MENQQPISVNRSQVPEPVDNDNIEQLRQQLMQVAITPEGQESLKRVAEQISHDPYNNEMKKQIWKFAINPNNIKIEMPKDAEIISIETQNETPCLSALVNPENVKELTQFQVYVIGHDIHIDKGIELKYINTFQLDGGSLVFHLFERVNNPCM